MEESVTRTSHRFLITYGTSGKTVTSSMWTKHSKVAVDECYTLRQRDLKYTLVHTIQRTTRFSVESFMATIDRLYSIKSTCIFGYNVVSMGNEINEHPGMQLIVECLNSNSPSLDCWVGGKDMKHYKRGLLYHHIIDLPVESMPRFLLVKRFKSLDNELKEYSAKNREMESNIEQLERENRRLKTRLEAQEFAFVRSGRSHLLLPPTP